MSWRASNLDATDATIGENAEGGCNGGSINDREFLEQVAFGGAVRLATVSFCIAVVGAVTSEAGLVAGVRACVAAAAVAGQVANRAVDV